MKLNIDFLENIDINYYYNIFLSLSLDNISHQKRKKDVYEIK